MATVASGVGTVISGLRIRIVGAIRVVGVGAIGSAIIRPAPVLVLLLLLFAARPGAVRVGVRIGVGAIRPGIRIRIVVATSSAEEGTKMTWRYLFALNGL